MKKTFGFTLMEAIVVIVIMAGIAVIVQPILSSAFDAYFTHRDLTDANWQGSLAFGGLTRGLHVIPPLNISTFTATTLAYKDATNNTVTYSCPAVGSTDMKRNTQILATGVSACSFDYYTCTGAVASTNSTICYVNITLTVTKNSVNNTLFTTVSLRNNI